MTAAFEEAAALTLSSLPVPATGGPWLLDSIEGSVYAIAETNRSASDSPIWARAVQWIAVSIGFGLAAAAFFVWRIGRFFSRHRHQHGATASLWSMVRRGTHGHHTHADSAFRAAFGAFLGARLGAHRPTLIQLWRIDTAGGAYAVRVPISPAHPFDVRVGDTVCCSGRLQRSRTMHAHHVFDRRTGEGIRVPLVRLEAVVVVAVAIIFLVLLLARL
jgi:hypothetical protein